VFNRKGQATAVGGVFFVLLMVTLIGLFLYQLDYEHRYVVQSLEAIEKRKKIYNEDLAISEKYTITRSYSASDVSAEVIVINGTLVSGSNSSLIDKGNNFIIIDSVAVVNLTVPGGSTVVTDEFVRNGEFNEGFKYWNLKNGVLGRWIIDVYPSNNNASVYYIRSLPSKMEDKARLSQDISVDVSPLYAELSFKYRITWDWPWWFSPKGFIEVWLLNQTSSTRIFGPRELSSSWTSPTISDLKISRGKYTLEFRVYVRNPSRWFLIRNCKIWIDKVSLVIRYQEDLEGYSSVIYGIKTELNLNLPECYNFSYKLLTKTSRSLIFEVYTFDFKNNIWKLESKFITPSDDWFNLTLSSPRIIIYSESQYSFEISFDYLYVETVELNPSEFILYIKNTGNVEADIVACWVKNETMKAIRYEIKQTLLPGDILEVDIPITLTRGSTYKIRVITRNQVFRFNFTP